MLLLYRLSNFGDVEYSDLKKDLQIICKQTELASDDSYMQLLQRLDLYAKQPGLPERLEHYLSKRSYVKALAWIDNPELPHQI